VIYLDNNATTLIDARVSEHMASLYRDRLANPSSQHALGRRSRQILEEAREDLLRACGGRTDGMDSDQLLFTSGGTESNNLAVFGFAAQKPGRVIVSSIEHSSVLAAAQHLETSGREVSYLPCEDSGVVNIERLREWLQHDAPRISVVSVMFANNETGVIQPVREIAHLCSSFGVPFHTDAVQGLSKVPLRLDEIGADAMTVTAHKLHGPLGIGALVLRKGVTLPPLHFGGSQQLGLRPGTEMPVLASGFRVAVAIGLGDSSARALHMDRLRRMMESRVKEMEPDALVIGESSDRLPHTSCIAFPGRDRQALQMALDHLGIACSSGSACASGSSQASHVLQAMRLAPEIIRGAIRFSLSFETSEDEVHQTLQALKKALDRIPRR
jgi:cysteine desulfurase